MNRGILDEGQCEYAVLGGDFARFRDRADGRVQQIIMLRAAPAGPSGLLVSLIRSEQAKPRAQG